MVRVRLSRGGGKKRPYYHIVVVDQKAKRDGKCIERIGSYDPNLESEKRITLKHDRLEHWVNQGAQMSNRVKPNPAKVRKTSIRMVHALLLDTPRHPKFQPELPFFHFLPISLLRGKGTIT